MIVRCVNEVGASYYGGVCHHTFFADGVKFTHATGSPAAPLQTVEFGSGEVALFTDQGTLIEARVLERREA